MFLVELGNDRDLLSRFVAQRVARWIGRRTPPSLSPEALKALAHRRLGLVRYTAPNAPRPNAPRPNG